MSAAFTLFGLSLVYGISGATNLSQVAASIHGPNLDPLLLLAMVMVAVGFAFKVAAAPFHLWAPDVYQGAPAVSAAFIASGSKLAGFFVFARVMMTGFAGAEGSAGWHAFKPGWVPVVALLAVASMFLGNIAALAQNSVRRLLAYSAIAHAGYLLLGVISSRQQGVAAVVYYALTYALTALGAFGVVAVVQAQTGSDNLRSFAGLSRRSPLLSLCMLIFVLSLAGIPPLAGFFGKFYVFAAALKLSTGMDLLWLVTLALVLSAVSLYYYLQVLKQIYVVEPDSVAGRITIPGPTLVVLVATALAVLILGCLPHLLVHQLEAAVSQAGW
jgi:NADH-quinone oxidoreductase subunit N